ncbi:MAG: crossover junction endodeoxyribonuclease RuvC [Planctomycetaceae bacterium]|jgi:crossover junction endodeoxyribonuclease RuvC|nr:crossover junction endodeoxyribonuclease RuvC [Planctomycetaceae bacterium]
MSIILGIDPGLNTTGYGVIETMVGNKLRLLEAGVVRSRSETLAPKVCEIYDGVREIIATFSPSAVAIEELYSHYDRPRTAIYMGHARGAICLAAAQTEITVYSYSATKIKKILTGAGRAPKEQMQRAIQLELHLDRFPEPPDVADALAVALCHCYHGKIC